MTYQAAVFDRFGGLNLSVDPSEAGSFAIDGEDFDLTPLGEVVSRAGTTAYTATTFPSRPLVFAGYGLGTSLVVLGEDFKLRVLSADSGITATSDVLEEGTPIPYATPAGVAVYGTLGTSFTTLAKWNGTAFSYPSTGYASFYGCVQPGDNRLVLAYVRVDGPSTIRFSDAGDPETFGADNYVMITPGREFITGCCAWGNSVFVFKPSHFVEFYGNSQASDGAPIFNYRTVDTGVGIRTGTRTSGIPTGVRGSACCAAPDGVYFFSERGIYRTTGSTPVKVSSQIDPVFTDGELSDVDYVAMGYANGRVYVSAASNATGGGLGTPVTYVYWLETQQWMRWSVPSAAWLALNGQIYFSDYTGSRIAYLDPAATTDTGTPITATYQSGFFDLGQSNLKTIRETLLTGKGTIGYQLTRDQAGFDQVPTSATELETVTLGSTAAKQGRVRRALRGAEFSYRLTGTAPWSVQRVAPGVRGARSAGVETPA